MRKRRHNDADLYDENYFVSRTMNDVKRLESFRREGRYISQYSSNSGAILDIGCSTGEFLTTIGWKGMKYGIEISELARGAAIETGIVFDECVVDQRDSFDVVIFRGTIQLLPNPFEYMQIAYDVLKPGGIVVFLATPNANSIVYKMFNTLPALDPRRDYWTPSDITLQSNLRKIGFQVVDVSYPYVDSPYANPVIDHLHFLKLLLLRGNPRFAFWRNMMNVVGRKPSE